MRSPELPQDRGALKLEVERGTVRLTLVQVAGREGSYEGAVTFSISTAQLRVMARAMIEAADEADGQMPTIEQAN